MGNRIRELRKSRGLTMKQLGEKLGLAESTISQYETGKRQPDNETLLELGEIFDVTVGYILGAEKEQPHVPEDIGPNKQILDFEKATKALSEAINKLNAGECTAKLGAEDIKVICPIDGTEQIIHQTYAIIGGKRFAQENNGCDNYSGHKECDLCRWRVTLKVTNG